MKSYRKLFVLVLSALFCLPVLGAEKKKSNSPLKKTAVSQYKNLDGNKLNSTISSEGPYCDYRRSGNSGLEWPKGSGKTPIYTAGIWLAGVHRPSGIIRMSNMDYGTEYLPGPIFNTFNTSTNNTEGADTRASDARYRLYKITKKDTVRDAGGKFTTTNADFLDWPGDLGAPYEDRNSNGVWDKGVDMPKFWGDMQMWCVINDLNVTSHNAISTSLPMGVEIQITYFCFNQAGALGDMMFMRWKIINKSDAAYDSCFIGMWSDPDLGNADDDLPGSDVNLSLGYIYNGDNDDAGSNGYGAQPPAVGFDFFQGPTVISPADSAIWGGVWHRGYRNLPASSYVVYTNGTFPQIIDPPDKDPKYISIAYDYMNGKAGTINQPLPAGSWTNNRFWFSGDPVRGTGDLPATFPLGSFSPQDVRIMINSGPFTLAAGDTQEIVGALLAAQGADRLGSVSKLKQVDDIAQQAFNDNFNVPSAPPMPPISSTELPDAIILDWSANTTATEAYNYRGYAFEGFKIYQTLNPYSPQPEWRLVKTFDKANGVGNIIDWVTNPLDGTPYLQPVVISPDTGLAYYFVIDKDYINGTSLIPGKKYFFALTTYARNTISNALELGLPMSLEYPKEVIEGRSSRGYLTPIGNAIGTDVPTEIGSFTTHSRPGDDAVAMEVVNPNLLTGLQYGVTINGSSVDTTVTGWNVLRYRPITSDSTAVDTVLKNVGDFSGSSKVRLADGMLVRVHRPQPGPRRDTDNPRGYAYNPSSNFWMASSVDANGAAVITDAMAGTLSYPRADVLNAKGTKVKPDSLLKIEIRFDSSRTQKAYRFARLRTTAFGPLPPPADSSFLPFMKRRLKTGFQYQDRVTVPFTVWDVDQSNGPKPARQLNVAFIETNDSLWNKDVNIYSPNDSIRQAALAKRYFVGRGKIDGKWEPTTHASGGGEKLYIFSSTYQDEPNDTLYVRSRTRPATDSLDIDVDQPNLDVMYILTPKAQTITGDATGKSKLWKNGDVLTILPYYALNSTRVFNYLTTAPTFENAELAKSQLDKINVFPNPYFGHNLAEQNTLTRFVTFSHLPKKAKIRIFTLNGELVRTLNHVDETGSTARTFERWDLRNENGLPVASGMFIAHVEIEGVGNKILKLAIIQPEERSTRL